MPADWPRRVNRPDADADGEGEQTRAIRECAARGHPFGSEGWSLRTAEALGLGSALRPRGRPRKEERIERAAEGEKGT